ncbi:ATP-binding protein [Actinoalloteichus spitiensis]|uniref:ATP-binding protein n=1 Tax=Actinoalloteichus spitiensis TaxID=252394 RepID=UPI00047444FC|nr:LuxR C-terminal-related transcriptional regulator [Actinoalloteichus spitiensis]
MSSAALPRSGRVPDDTTSFVGRRQAVSQVRKLLATSRLVTLTGVGGVGKSRLAVSVARRLQRAFPDGCWLVDLDRLTDPGLLDTEVSAELGVFDQSGQNPREALLSHLRGRRLLLVLDGCDRFVEECGALVAEVLAEAPEVRVLATSREPLRVAGEHIWPVPPLDVPRSGRTGSGQREAVLLFEQRAAAVLPGFRVDESNRDAVVRLCQRLDGLPLAIELAAGRMRTLSVHQVLARLEDRYAFLTGGDRSALPRHQTLRAAIEWSYDLCDARERELWARLSVFAGAFELRSAEEVCSGDGLPRGEVFGALAGLVDRSVLSREWSVGGSEARYRLLESIREFGREHLDATRLRTLRRRHRDHYLDMVSRDAEEWFGPGQRDRIAKLAADQFNLWAALDFCRTEPGEARTGQRLAALLAFFWIALGQLRDGRHWLDGLLAEDETPSHDRTHALSIAGMITAMQGETTAGFARAWRAAEEAREAGDTEALHYVDHSVGTTAMLDERHEIAEEHLVRAVRSGREDGRWTGLTVMALPNLAVNSLLGGDADRAVRLCDEAVRLSDEHGDEWCLSWSLWVTALARWARGELASIPDIIRRCVEIKQSFGDVLGIVHALELLAWVAAARGEHQRAAVLLGASRRLWRPLGVYLFELAPYVRWHRECEESSLAALGTRRFDAGAARGERFDLAEAVDYALGRSPSTRREAGGEPAVLTRREWEVARLVAEGLSNRAVAERLVISRRTAETHVEHILGKLGFRSRTQIASWVAERPAGGDGPGASG